MAHCPVVRLVLAGLLAAPAAAAPAAAPAVGPAVGPAAGPAGGGVTWTVDDNGTGDFVHIQDAVDAAQDGDVIAVLDGAYAGFAIDGKSLVVAGEPGGDVRVAAYVLVQNLAAGQRVELDHLRIGLTFSGLAFATLRLADNLGAVRIVDCEVHGVDNAGYYAYYSRGIGCYASEEVGVLRCSVEGGYHDYYGGSQGIYVDQSHILITDSTIVGEDGFSSETWGSDGANAVLALNSSTVECVGSSLTGGDGGNATGICDCCCTDGSDVAGIAFGSGSTGTWNGCTFDGSPVPPPFVTQMEETPFAAFCFGTWAECPCGNNGAPRAGCEVSYGSGGVELSAAGNPSVSDDTVTLSATGFRATGFPSGLFFQGTTRVGGGQGAPFNDGLLCAGGTILRLKGKLASGGSMTFGFGNPADLPVSVRGALPPEGGTRTYQVWFRNQAPQWCTAERFNMSNGLTITWQP